MAGVARRGISSACPRKSLPRARLPARNACARWPEGNAHERQRCAVLRQARQNARRVHARLAATAAASRRCAQHLLFDAVGFADLGCYGSPIATPTIDGLADRACATPASTPPPCLDDARGAAHRAQPPCGRHGLPRQFRQRPSGISRQDRPDDRHACRDAASARLSQLHARQSPRTALDAAAAGRAEMGRQ